MVAQANTTISATAKSTAHP